VRRIVEPLKRAAWQKQRQAVLNKMRRLEMYDYVMTTWADNPGLGVEAMLAGVTKGARKGSRSSVIATHSSLFAKHAMGVVYEMEVAGIHNAYVKGELDADIFKAMHEMDKKSGQNFDGINPDARKAAEIIQKFNESMRVLANRWGADIGKLDGYVHKRIHDDAKIKADREGWMGFIRENVDWDRSFPDVPVADRDALMQRLYHRLSQGVHLTSEYGAPRARPESKFLGIANIGRKVSHERVMHFKNGAAEFEYSKKYGAPKLSESVMYGMEKMSRDIAIMKHLGPNADANIRTVREQILKQMEKDNNPNAGKFDRKFEQIMRTLWPHINGLANVPGSHMAAQVSQTARAIQQWSKLGGAMISGFADISFSASEVKYQGGSFLSGVLEALTSLGENMPKSERARLMASLGVIHDGMISAMTKRFDVSDTTPGRVSAITSLFFKVNGLRWWTDQIRTGFAASRSHDLGLQANRAFDQLDEGLQRVFGFYGIDSSKWDIIRSNPETFADKVMLTPEGVENLPDEVFSNFLRDAGQPVTKRRIDDAREEIAGQFREYFYDRANMAVIEPDDKTRSYLLRGTRPGTVEGETLRHLALFKSFTATVFQKPLAREIYGKGANTLGEAMRNGNGEMTGLARLILWNTAFGYLAMSAKDLAKGREPRDPDNVKTWMAAMVQGGGMGIYGDFLFGDMKNRFGGGALTTLAGPTAGVFDDIVDIFQRLRDGDDAAAAAWRTTIQNTPFINLFYTKAALDYLILHGIQEAMNPGSMKRAEKRLLEENEQTHFFPPSQHAVTF